MSFQRQSRALSKPPTQVCEVLCHTGIVDDPVASELDEDKAIQQLEQEEAEARPVGSTPMHSTSATSFIQQGLNLEESQCVLTLFSPEMKLNFVPLDAV